MTRDYLKDVSTEDVWLAKRKLQWLGDDNTQGLKYRLFKFHDDPQSEIEAFEEYFFKGDIKLLIEKSERVSFSKIIFFSPVQSFSAMRMVLSEAVRWLLGNKDDIQQPLDDYLSAVLNTIISPALGYYLSDNVALEMFFWLFGEQFEPKRSCQLIEDEEPVSFEFTVDAELLCLQLLSGMRDLIWEQCDRRDGSRFKALIPYFISFYPHLDPEYFSKTIPHESSFKIGSPVSRGTYIIQRHFIASLHGIVTEHDLDDDYEELEELVINDAEALEKLKSGLEAISMPNEYYELEKFVLDKKEECLEASE